MLTVNFYHLATYPTLTLDKQVIALKIQMSNYRKPCKTKSIRESHIQGKPYDRNRVVPANDS